MNENEHENHHRVKKYKRRSERWKKISSGVPLRIRQPGSVELLVMGLIVGMLIGLLLGLSIRGIKLWPTKTTVVEYRPPDEMPRSGRSSEQGAVNEMAQEAINKLKEAGYSMEEVRGMYNLSEETLKGISGEHPEGLPPN